jgi:hypothetical protein
MAQRDASGGTRRGGDSRAGGNPQDAADDEIPAETNDAAGWTAEWLVLLVVLVLVALGSVAVLLLVPGH